MEKIDWGYSDNALIARIEFFDIENNKFNIFVEDENKEYEYEKIFNRMFGNTAIIKNNIYGMGGKKNMEKLFEKYGEYYKSVPLIYLVDGDFDVILEKRMIQNEHYIYLERYNIESYFFDKNEIINYVSGKLQQCNYEVEQKLEYEKWENDTYNKLYDLFLLYTISKDLVPEAKIITNSAYKFLNKDTGYFYEGKINKYREDLSRKINNLNEHIPEYEKRFISKLNNDKKRLICGKYIFDGLFCYLQKKGIRHMNKNDFRYFLVTNFDIHKLEYVKERIELICNKKIS